jgi:hypothetical protein
MQTADDPADGPIVPFLQARAHLLETSKRRIEAFDRRVINRPTVDTLRGELALHEGRTADAIQYLRAGIDGLWGHPTGEMYRATESLAEALERERDVPGAIAVLERMAPDRAGAYPYGAWWMRSQARLAELYVQAGRRDDARAVVEDLERLLVVADSDFPLVTRVRRLRDGQ